jgi:hypothetical protein
MISLLYPGCARPMDQRLKDSYEVWLKGMRWDWYVTPTFRAPKTQGQAVAAVKEWLASKPGAYAAVAYERGSLGGRLHVHAVIGGIGRDDAVGIDLMQSWRRGIIEVKRYDPSRRGIRYMLDQADDPDGMELMGKPVAYRPRRRQRRREGNDDSTKT